MARTHRKIFLNNEIYKLYSLFNRILKYYVENSSGENNTSQFQGNDFVKLLRDKINFLCEKYENDDVNSEAICMDLVKEKCKQMMVDEEFFRQLMQFSGREILGNMSVKELDIFQIADLKRILKLRGNN